MYDRYGEDGLKSTVGGGQAGAYAVLTTLNSYILCVHFCIYYCYLHFNFYYRQIRLICLRHSLGLVWVVLLVVTQPDLEDAVPLLLLKVKIYGELVS